MTDKIYDIIPFKSVGEISFDDTREQIRQKIGGRIMDGEYRFQDIIELYDYFPESDIKVLYDKPGNLSAIEFYRGKVFFQDKDIFNLPYLELKRYFEGIDPQLEFDLGFKSYKYGVGVGGDDEDNLVTSVIVFKNNYYD